MRSMISTFLRSACIKGQPHEDAVLCTSSATYALKHVETTNALLLIPPQHVRLSILYRVMSPHYTSKP